MQIYIAEGTQQTGPFDLETITAGLRTGKYQPTQLAWYEGAPGWEPISRLPGMEAVMVPSPAPPMPPAFPVPPAVPPGAYATPPPPSFIPVVSAPYTPGPGPVVPPKRSVWALIGSVCLGLLAVLFGLAKIAKVFLPHRSSGSSYTTYSSTPTPGPSVKGPGMFSSLPAAGTKRFTADRSNYDGDLEAHFVAFTFDYPEDWTLEENTDNSYVTLKHFVRLPSGKNVQAEYVSFSYAYNKPGYPMSTNLSVSGPQLLAMTVDPAMKNSPTATKTPARSGHFGRYASEEVLVTDHLKDGKTGLYSRVAVVAQPNDSTDGLSVTFVGSETAGNKSAETLGDSGGLRTIRDSFRFGP